MRQKQKKKQRGQTIQRKWHVKDGTMKDGTHAIQGARHAHTNIKIAWRRLEVVSYTIFVDNFPKNHDKILALVDFQF